MDLSGGDILWLLEDDHCPCDPMWRQRRQLQDANETWEITYTCMVLFLMFAALISDRIGADSVMLGALTLFMTAEIISIEEGLKGFSNEGLLTVLVLFVVAEGISKTGALDWYMGKLLGRPKSMASAQLRLMVPIAIVSAFLNNTPVVAVMIPIVQRWGKNIGVSPQQLLVPLSFASILGGTCTLIGTSTNLVVKGLLDTRYPNDPSVSIGLFSLGVYGVPVALAGMTYILLASPFLLPGAVRKTDGTNPLENSEDILLGARLTQWSPAAGRSVKRSGLRDTGGIYLVSVLRGATGYMHRAVGQDFVLNVGDTLYFTGLVEGFGLFCEDHGLEVVTNEVQTALQPSVATEPTDSLEAPTIEDAARPTEEPTSPPDASFRNDKLETVMEGEDLEFDIPVEVGVTKESLVQADYAERKRNIIRMTDMIRGSSKMEEELDQLPADGLIISAPPKIVVTIDHDLVVVAINTKDRAGLLLDISKGLLRLKLELHHTEAAVVGRRSLSVWRCEQSSEDLPDLEEIWSILSALLEGESGIEAVKKRGLRVVRARVTEYSSLVGRVAGDVNFRERYKAAIVAVQQAGRNVNSGLSSVRFEAGDVLILQASNDSPVLATPPKDFYKNLGEDKRPSMARPNSVQSLVNLVRGRKSNGDLLSLSETSESTAQVRKSNLDLQSVPGTSENDLGVTSENVSLGYDVGYDEEALAVAKSESLDHTEAHIDKNVLRDLQLLQSDDKDEENQAGAKEFLTAMAVASNSQLTGQTVGKAGINKLPGVVLVSIDRPVASKDSDNKKSYPILPSDSSWTGGSAGDYASVKTVEQQFTTISQDEPLQGGDILWFAGSASTIGDLRKIPGLVSYENEEVEKMNENVFDRRLVQAVISRKAPLVGKTVKEARFRTRFGAAVIAVHREGNRIHDHPGNIKLQAGDVLLLEAGSTFIGKAAQHDNSFALLAEVEDSAPPRLRLLIPALFITAAMLSVFTAGVASLLVCALVASILMIVSGILSEQEARNAVNWEVFITIASAFGIGTALVNSGVAGIVASFLVDVGEAVGIGDAGLLAAVYLATFMISNVVTNNAAAALLFPIALDAAETTGTDRLVMSYCLMLGASASFMSPFGYTTNLLIYGPGGYKYGDFLTIGTPMQLVLWILSILFLASSYSWMFSWIATFLLFMVVVAMRVFEINVMRGNSHSSSVKE